VKRLDESKGHVPLWQEPLKWKITGAQFVLLFEDPDMEPVVFTGEGSENAAIRAFQSKSAEQNCRVFAGVVLVDSKSDIPSYAANDAFITVHEHRQVRVEVFDDRQRRCESQAFNRMAEARLWLSERGFRDDQITLKVEQSCDRPADSSGFLGIFRCANCQDSCV